MPISSKIKVKTHVAQEGVQPMYSNSLESPGLLIFFMIISFILAALYIRERIKNSAK